MKFEELIAELDVRKVAIEPEPINPDFVSLAELLERVQAAPAKPLTLTQAAHILLSLGFRTGGAPEWKCNGKLGIVPIEAFNYEWAVKRLEYVFHSNRFESDGNGASTDYDFFGFDRKEFADFLSHKVGEPLDLFCPMPEPQADSAPAQNTVSASVIVHSTKARRDALTPVIEFAQRQCRSPKDDAEVWAALQPLAEKKTPPLIGATEEGLQYLKSGKAEIFTRDALRKRLNR